VRKTSVGYLLVALLAAGPATQGCAGEDRRPRGPSVLLMTIDTLRADHLGCYNQTAPARTPFIDSLAERGVLFEKAWTTVPLTTPAHASMLTGLYPTAHGVRNNARYRLPESSLSIATLLADQGYSTGAFVSSYTTSRVFGLARGFETYDDDMGHDPSGRVRPQRPGTEIIDRALSWFDTLGKNDAFFAWTHFFDPHSPYTPPPRYAAEYEDLYAAEVAYTDELIGLFLEELESRGRLDDTIIILVSDHGEGLRTHGEIEHGILLYEETVQVPLIIVAPERVEAGRRIRSLASIVDLAPTLLALLDLPIPQEMQGIDLLQADADPSRLLYAETLQPYEELGWSPLYALRRADTKVILSSKSEAYDLAVDPRESKDLSDDRELIESFEKLFRHFIETRSRPEMLAEALGGAIEETTESLERLESLGYVAGGGAAGNETMVAPPLEGRNPREAIEDYHRFQRANLLVKQGQADAGVRILERLVQNDPNNPQFLLKSALALAKTGRDDAAEARFEEVMQKHPNFVIGTRFFAAHLLARGRPLEARSVWLAFLERYPDPVDVADEIARCEIAAGLPEQAAERLSVQVDRHPEDLESWHELGRAREAMGLRDEALLAFTRALTIRPTFRPALSEAMRIYRDSDQREQAIALLERLVEKAPEDPLLQEWLKKWSASR